MMTPKIPNKGCSLRQGSGGIGGKKGEKGNGAIPAAARETGFWQARHKRGGVGRNNRGVLNVSGNGM